MNCAKLSQISNYKRSEWAFEVELFGLTRPRLHYNLTMKIPLASSGLREVDILAINRVLRSGNLTMGAQVKDFENQMASYLNVKHFVMVNSGSSANLAIFEALLRPAYNEPQLQLGDAVLVPAVAWPTTVWPILQLGLKPVFVDVELTNLGIDLSEAQKLIDSGNYPIKAIFPIHPLGKALDPAPLGDFCLKNNLKQVNDVCESLGSWTGGIHAGTSGLAASFSFYFSHHLTTMEGGGVATNEDNFADDLRSIRSHGWSRDRYDSAEWSRLNKSNDDKFLFVSTGYNIRPMEIQAAVGIEQLKSLDGFISRRRIIARSIHSVTKNTSLRLIGGETLESLDLCETHSWMLLPFIIEREEPGIRQFALKFLQEQGIETRPILTGNFLAQPALKRITQVTQSESDFPIANFISSQGFMIGAHHDLTDEQLTYLCESITELSYRIDRE
jgi:CDP-6-deoxy-D-xylo-4-hexulose-3-dehydrase